MGTVEDGLFDYDLGFGEQQLNPNSQVITSSSQTPRDFPKQTLLNPIFRAFTEKALGLCEPTNRVSLLKIVFLNTF